MFLNKLILFVSVILYSLIGFVSSCISDSNIAALKKYTVFPTHNYPLSAPIADNRSLTDGIYTIGNFWTQKSTVGWQYVQNVEILIDLGTEFNIDSVAFNTARGMQAEVNYPAQIAVFVGSTKDKFLYVGDIAKSPDNVIGPYQTKKFTLRGISARARYVLLVVKPNGPYLFCDEIEVLEGREVIQRAGTLTKGDARLLAESLRRLDVEKEFLSSLISELNTGTSGADVTEPLAKVRQKVDNLAAITDAEPVEEEILRWRAHLLRARFPGKRFLVEGVNPWASLSPASIEHSPFDGISLIIPQRGYDYAAFVVTNLIADPQEMSIQTGALSHEAPDLAIYHVPFVKSAKMKYVADPLMPIANSVKLRSGESRMVFMAAYGNTPGKWQSILKVDVGADAQSFPLDIQISDVAVPVNTSLNSINWGYLDFKPIKHLKYAAVKDLFAHHTNTIVVPPEYVPFVHPTKVSDVIRLNKYLQMHKGASKIMFFVNFNNNNLLTANGKYVFFSDEWKYAFRKFYERLLKSALQAGFSDDQLYFYLFDEMKGKEIEQFVTIAAWARKEMPAIKFYATLSNKEAFKALPYLDISQVVDHKDMNRVIDSNKEMWLYGTAENTKSLSPYSYYRLMSWKAFYLGYTGVGFWNYADTGWGENPGSAWDDFDGKRPDFAVIYEGPGNTIVSSRRWEAWRMGIEDYDLLTRYAKVRGEKSAKELAKIVLNNPKDVGKADEVRRKILQTLSQ